MFYHVCTKLTNIFSSVWFGGADAVRRTERRRKTPPNTQDACKALFMRVPSGCSRFLVVFEPQTRRQNGLDASAKKSCAKGSPGGAREVSRALSTGSPPFGPKAKGHGLRSVPSSQVALSAASVASEVRAAAPAHTFHPPASLRRPGRCDEPRARGWNCLGRFAFNSETR